MSLARNPGDVPSETGEHRGSYRLYCTRYDHVNKKKNTLKTKEKEVLAAAKVTGQVQMTRPNEYMRKSTYISQMRVDEISKS